MWKEKKMIELRPYQVDLVGRVRESFASGVKRVLMQAPCGSGKTCIFAHIADRVARRGKRVLILVHRRELCAQTVDKLASYGVQPDLIVSGTRDIARGHVAVASIQTLARRLALYQDDPWDLVILDEAHHCMAPTFKRVLDHFPRAYQLGVSATPSRLDGRGLADCYDELIVGPHVRGLIDQGFLADFVCFSHPTSPDLGGLKVRAGDYAQDELADTMSRPQLLGDAVSHYARHLDGAPAIAFGVTIRHAEILAEAFRAAGWRSTNVDGTLADDERDKRIRGLADGSVQVLTSCSLIDEGLDVPCTTGVILCRPTKSLNIYTQQVGRALRPKDRKAVILDHAGVVPSFGLPDTPHPWSLTSDKRKPAEHSTIKVCKACFATVPITCKVCPECQTPFPLAIPKPPPRAKDGQLVEVTSWLHVDRSREGIAAAIRQCRSWRELKALGKHLGFRNGWAYHAARDRGWRPITNGMGYTTGFVPPLPGYGSGEA
jgi:DNA repair protein RadD